MNFTLQELAGSSLAFVLFSFVYVIPGYVAAWGLDLFDFRKRLAATRFVIAIVVSMAISPAITFLAYDLGSATLAFLLLAVLTFTFAAILLRTGRVAPAPGTPRLQRFALVAAGGWTLFVLLSLVDVQWGNALYYNRVSYDFTTRVAIINAITRSGVPPINPSWFPGHPVRLTYVYYFWYVPCSLMDQLGGTWVDGHAAMIASVAWCGLALVGSIGLYMRLRNPEAGASAWKSGLLGAGLLLVSGLDVIPALFSLNTVLGALHGDLEHWNEQITAWIGAISWVPHHVAAMVACMVAVMLVHWMRGQTWRTQAGAAVVAGLAFASGFGLSVFVTLVFVTFWVIWLVVLFIRDDRRLSGWMVLAGIVALAAAGPFLLGLLSGNNASAIGSGLPVSLAVRIFRPLIPYVISYPPALLNLAFLLVLPISYLMELGFFLIAALFWLETHGKAEWKQNTYYLSELILLGVTLFIASFVRSTVIESNDLGWRAWLPGQFVLLIWGADVLRRLPSLPAAASPSESRRVRMRRLLLNTLLIMGLMTTVLDVVLLRTWSMLENAGLTNTPGGPAADEQIGRRTFAARQAYDYINAHTAANTVIEPDPVDLLNIPVGLYADRQIAVSGHTAYGVPQQVLFARASTVAEIFRATNWLDIDAACRRNGIDLIVANDLDPLWMSLRVLEQQRAPLYQNEYYAVFGCGAYLDP